MDCLFCKIAKREIKSTVIYEDDLCLAFEDVNPKAPLHSLIIPKRHIDSAASVTKGDRELIGHLYYVGAKIARERGVEESGYRLVNNCNGDAGQSVFHIHIHLLGGRVMSWPPG